MIGNSRVFLLALSFGLAALGMPCAAHAQAGQGGNTCVFVFGAINGQSVTIPSTMVVVPSDDLVLGPTRVHVDPTSQTVLGFTLTTPGVDQTVNGTTLFVPGVDTTVPSFSATLDNLNVSSKTCLNFGVAIPAVEIDVPASLLAIPGAVANTPEITINALGVQKTVDGQAVIINFQTIVIPGIHEVTPVVTAGTPDRTIAVNLNGIAGVAGILDTTTPDGVHEVPLPAFDPVIPSGCQVQ